MNSNSEERGVTTLGEILSQPSCWQECLKVVRDQNYLGELQQVASLASDWLIVGCGSSYYAAQVAAASWTVLTGRQVRAFPASEELLFPELVVPHSRACHPILISRSGRTSEVLKAAEHFRTKQGLNPLAISCVQGQPLEKLANPTIILPSADEKSVVMTRSFTSMILALQYLVASWTGNKAFQVGLENISGPIEKLLPQLRSRMEEFVATHEFEDYVFLAQGPLYGIASEAALKVKEMSRSYAQCFHTLEFRHGPKAIVSPKTLITFFVSETAYAAECEMLQEVKSLGGVTLVVTNSADDALRRSADLLVDLNLDVPEYARSIAYIPTGQLLGLYTGRKKGIDSDRPPNLNRAVILKD